MEGSTSFGVIYYVFAALVIICLVAFALMRIFPNLREKINKAVTKKYQPLARQESVQKILMNFRKFVSSPVKIAIKIISNKLGVTSCHLQKAEVFIQKAVPAVTTEPVNLLALVIRKCYTDDPSPLIALTASLIVVFYFILTVF